MIDGETAILLRAPPNGNASFSIDVTKPLDIAPGELVSLIASIRVGDIGAPNSQLGFLLRRESTGSRLQMIMDEKSIYDKELETTGGKFEEVESEKTNISDNPKVSMLQESGDNPVDLTVRGLMLVEAERAALSAETTRTESAPSGQETSVTSGNGKGGGGRESGSFSSVSSLSETGTGAGTSPASPTSSGPVAIVPNEGGHNLMVNRVAVYVVPLITALLL
ncbi:hypothetical protein NW755_010249 [Fusarium falciforme]|uniref:Uncharacterized protein n=1 Tax=Fusarium falciforme TaxID=195108 RepID=A0A9W8QZI8_9HYPO|nr:hypothetical protein NW755_010249 [Fusarium falciforme]